MKWCTWWSELWNVFVLSSLLSYFNIAFIICLFVGIFFKIVLRYFFAITINSNDTLNDDYLSKIKLLNTLKNSDKLLQIISEENVKPVSD